MTRTARSTSLKAMIKDRSENKTGIQQGLRKGGGGQHNWGNVYDERELEEAAINDEEYELEDDALNVDDTANSVSSDELKKPALSPRAPSDEEIQSARQVRKNALKKGVDLSEIARSSAAAHSPAVDKFPSSESKTTTAALV